MQQSLLVQLKKLTGCDELSALHRIDRETAGLVMLGLPLEGDLFYPEALRGPGAPEDFSQALQLLAQRIAFTDPVTGAERVFESQRSLRDAPSSAAPEKN